MTPKVKAEVCLKKFPCINASSDLHISAAERPPQHHKPGILGKAKKAFEDLKGDD